jgi:ferredoxin
MLVRSGAMSKVISIMLLSAAVVATAFFSCAKSANGPMNPTQGAYLSVDPDLCSGCRKCAGVCNADAVTFIGNKAVIDPTKCIQCFKCLDACPYDAIY